MRFLKTKIMKALEASKKKLDIEPISSPLERETALDTTLSPSTQYSQDLTICISEFFTDNQPKTPCRRKSSDKPRRIPSSTKNMTINFGKAIASFAASNLAMPYLKTYLDQKGFAYVNFLDFATKAKNSIRSIETFRNLIMAQGTDSPGQITMKETLQAMAEIFIKYFSVNWIIHGKVTNKMVYLKYRYKMLRRIQNPENFTYIKKRFR